MKDETQFLIEIANQFGKDAQNVLDFVAKSGNLEKAAKALNKTEATGSNEGLSDGVYFIADEECDKVYARNYCKYRSDMTIAPFPTKYIGVKMGQRAIAVALKDLPGDDDGGLKLLPTDHTSPKISEHYSYDIETRSFRFNAFEDLDGKANTARLKEYGCTIDLPEGEWIPSTGELALLMIHAGMVNRAIELAGGEPIKGWRLSSTEQSQSFAWFVNFSDGNTSNNYKCQSCAVRAVSTF